MGTNIETDPEETVEALERLHSHVKSGRLAQLSAELWTQPRILWAKHPKPGADTLLGCAIRHAQIEAARLLLGRGADPKEPSGDGSTPEQIAASLPDAHPNRAALLKMLAECAERRVDKPLVQKPKG